MGSLPPSGCWDPVMCPLLALKSGLGAAGKLLCPVSPVAPETPSGIARGWRQVPGF